MHMKGSDKAVFYNYDMKVILSSLLFLFDAESNVSHKIQMSCTLLVN